MRSGCIGHLSLSIACLLPAQTPAFCIDFHAGYLEEAAYDV
jgi:hypothetical protein